MIKPFRWGLLPSLRRVWRPLGVIALLVFLLSGRAFAAEVVDAENSYHLPQDQTISDDLTVTAQEIIIDGTVEGDLVAFGAYVEVNGTVTGDLIAAGAEVRINGVVQDDARVAGAGVHITGNVGDDLFAAAGGSWPGFAMFPSMSAPGRALTPGLTTAPSAIVGGDAYLAAAQATVDGAVRGNLTAGMESLLLRATVDGDAFLYVNKLVSGETAQVRGNLHYSAPAESASLPQVDGTVTRVTPEPRPQPEPSPAQPVWNVLWWLLRTVMLLAGTFLAGALLWQFAPKLLRRPVTALERRGAEASLYGVLIAAALIPVSGALIFIGVLFWGWFVGGIVVSAFLFGLIGLAWVFSPLVTGLWLGRWLFRVAHTSRGDFYAMLLGSGLIVLTARLLSIIPCLGGLVSWLVYPLSFALAIGGIVLARRVAHEQALEAASSGPTPGPTVAA